MIIAEYDILPLQDFKGIDCAKGSESHEIFFFPFRKKKMKKKTKSDISFVKFN